MKQPLFSFLGVFLLALSPLSTRADYPGQPLVWTPCGSSFCGVLEFCKEGRTSYGYINPGIGGPCGSTPGPLIRMEPGNVYKLTLRNTAADPAIKTNIHTHGLHIVGDGDGDDVTRKVAGGECLEYTWNIASDHPGGTYWYHPHYHTETNAQVDGGAFGMLIIEDDLSAPPIIGEELILQISDTGTVLGNGKINDVLEMVGGRWYRLRLSVVTPRAKPSGIVFDGDCIVYKVASDGVWHTASFDAYPGTVFEMTGASRADFAIKCNSNAVIAWGNQAAATLSVSNYEFTSSTPPGSAPLRPYSLSNIATVHVPPENKFDVTLSASQINGLTWEDHTSLGTIAWDEVHEWKISGSGAHPFHLHLYHMLIVTPGGCGMHKEGEFYDTISVPGSCSVRFKTADFGQMLIMHCHVLSHEDNGAMVYMDVAGPGMPENNIDSPSYACPAGTTPTPAPVFAPTTSAPVPAPITPSPVQTQTTSSPVLAPATNAPVLADTTPSPVPAPTTTSPVQAPVTPVCPVTCTRNSDCCSGNCNTNQGLCKGNNNLRRVMMLD